MTESKPISGRGQEDLMDSATPSLHFAAIKLLFLACITKCSTYLYKDLNKKTRNLSQQCMPFDYLAPILPCTGLYPFTTQPLNNTKLSLLLTLSSGKNPRSTSTKPNTSCKLNKAELLLKLNLNSLIVAAVKAYMARLRQ